MENEIVIDVKNVEKSFRVYKDKGNTIKSKVLFSSRRAYEERKVLRGISFQVRRGEAIGLIGHNGCGKSTTLKLLTRIIYPDKGSITMKGVASYRQPFCLCRCPSTRYSPGVSFVLPVGKYRNPL